MTQECENRQDVVLIDWLLNSDNLASSTETRALRAHAVEMIREFAADCVQLHAVSASRARRVLEWLSRCKKKKRA